MYMSDEISPQPKEQTVDLQSDGMTDLFTHAPIYVKYTSVQAYPATNGTTIETWLQDGERRGGVTPTREGDWLVVDEYGERWVMAEQELRHWYHPTESGDVFIALTGWARAFSNPTAGPVAGLLDGKVITGGADCMFVMEANGERLDEPTNRRRFVAAQDFTMSYMPYDRAVQYFYSTGVKRAGSWLRSLFHKVSIRRKSR